MSPGIMPVSFVFLGIGMLVSLVLKNKFNKYGKTAPAGFMTGREIAENMLPENRIYGVQVISAEGFLSDHYNPAKKTLNLGPELFNGVSIAALPGQPAGADMPFRMQELINH